MRTPAADAPARALREAVRRNRAAGSAAIATATATARVAATATGIAAAGVAATGGGVDRGVDGAHRGVERRQDVGGHAPEVEVANIEWITGIRVGAGDGRVHHTAHARAVVVIDARQPRLLAQLAQVGEQVLIGRIGFTARGAVYLIVGWLAVLAAVGVGRTATDTHGALEAITQQPLGVHARHSMSHLLGYAGVSTADQNPDLQLDALHAVGCYRVFVDTASGALDDRQELAKVLDQLRPADTLVVWKLDRLGTLAASSH
jgi:Resolvase, N terminal domain/Domain of Unknown Function (DUF1206)